jgi:hypothetical protein
MKPDRIYPLLKKAMHGPAHYLVIFSIFRPVYRFGLESSDLTHNVLTRSMGMGQGVLEGLEEAKN